MAAIGVLESHAYALPRGFSPGSSATASGRVGLIGASGVYVFFALTGYLLFLPFVRRIIDPSRRPDLRRYAFNRVVRILPLYWFVVAVLLLWQEGGGTATQWWRFLFFAESFWRSTLTTVDSPMWSLVVEVHFYILLPFLAWAITGIARGSLNRAAVTVGVLAGASIVLRRVTYSTDPRSLLHFSLPTTFFLFCSGMLVAIARTAVEREGLPDWLRRTTFHRSTVWFVVTLPLWAFVVERPSVAGEVAVAVSAGLIVGATVLPLDTGVVLRILGWRPLALLGVASYSFYLWHRPLLAELQSHDASWFGVSGTAPVLFLQGCLLMIPISAVSYALIERPFLRLRQRWQPRLPVPPQAVVEAAP